jgi:signal transduction histidine kinase
VGHLASGMAHEIGNPLSAVLAYLNLARRKDDPRERDDLLQRAETEGARIDHIIRDMLDYAVADSRGEERETEQCCPVSDPLQVIHETVEMLHHQGVFKQRQLGLDLPPQLPGCCIPPNQRYEPSAAAGGVRSLFQWREARWTRSGAVCVLSAAQGMWRGYHAYQHTGRGELFHRASAASHP